MIRTGLIGFGLGGRVFHAPFVSVTPGMDLTAVVQRGPWKQPFPSASEQYPHVRIVDSVDALLELQDLDLIVISTPNDSHFQLAHAALSAGKHVVVDKPLTTTSAESHQLLSLAASKNLVLAPFQNRRFDADFRTVQKVLDSGRLGRLVTFRAHFDRFRPGLRANTWKEGSNPANGILFDLGPHLADQPLALFGKPDYVTASVRHDRDGSQIDDAFDMRLDYPGLTVHLSSSMIAASPSPRFLLHGTGGSFVKYGLDPQEPALLAGQRPTVDGEWLREPESAYGTLITADPATSNSTLSETVVSETGDYRLFFANVRDAINGKAELTIPAIHGLRIIRCLELARQSSEEKRSIPFTEADWNCR
ncbi:Gfo/Idh/MocA family oxidoreductase [Terriglobus tenax]|uniref:Gfo/Idh/MocA family oxidoreductase n=1 Tax=Terriglobus tenax TaxID=1111115 RepID=UPI0021E0386C|nr:Gfo/Idh/MocA family oxidoreductase [Terriglobus tenax]